MLNPWNIDALSEIEQETGKRIFNILQLRLHPVIKKLKLDIENGQPDRIHDIDLTYITSRGKWYDISWKGNIQKSGGIATNLGLERARVRWFLSIDTNDLPQNIKEKGQKTYRSIQIDNHELEFSEGFTELHNLSYVGILNGSGFRIQEARKSIETVYVIRNATPTGLKGNYHPFC